MDSKYIELLDGDVLEFVRQSESVYPADALTLSISQQRNVYSQLSNKFSGAWPGDVTTANEFYHGREGSVPVRHYQNTRRAAKGRIVYFHGGGFILGGFDTHDSICADLCAQSCFDVTAVDYRLAPEFPHPASYDDCLLALRRVSGDWSGPLVVMGDSAGASLAAAVCHETREEKCRPDGQILIYPCLSVGETTGSFAEHSNAPLLSTADMVQYDKLRGGGRDLSTDISAAPLASDDFSNLPTTMVFAAEFDPLFDDGARYCSEITAAGGAAEFVSGEGLVHGYLRARHSTIRGAANFRQIINGVNRFAPSD